MVEKVAPELASSRRLPLKQAELWESSPHGWDTLLDGELDASAEANETLTGCKRLEKENRRQERLHFQEHLTSMHQFTNLSATAAPFQPGPTSPTPRLTSVARGSPGLERDFSPPRRTMGSPLSGIPSSHTSDNGGLTTNGSTTEATSHRMK